MNAIDTEEAHHAIEVAKTMCAELTPEGIGAYEPGMKLVFHGETFERCRNEFNPEQVATAIAFLRLCIPTKVPTKGSYGLKHEAECWGRRNGRCRYVANGELIAAAIYLGFCISDKACGPNVDVGVHRRSLRKLQPEEHAPKLLPAGGQTKTEPGSNQTGFLVH